MKKCIVSISLIFVIILSLGFCFIPSNVAYAETTQYIKIPVSDLEHNATAPESKIGIYKANELLFYLPESYYLKYDYTLADFYFVIYGNIENAYILKSDFDKINKQIKFVDPNFANNQLAYCNQRFYLKDKSVMNIDGKDIVNNTEKPFTIRCLGSKDDKFYVTADNGTESYAGLVDKNLFTDNAIQYHDITKDERIALLTQNKPKPADEAKATTSKTLRIILIVGIVVPAVLIVFLLFMPSKGSKTNYDKRTMKKNKKPTDYDRERNYNKEVDRPREYDRSYGRDYYDRPRDYRDYDRRDYDRPRNEAPSDYDYRRDYRDDERRY